MSKRPLSARASRAAYANEKVEHQGKRVRNQLSLHILPQLNRYPFVNNPLDVHVSLLDDNGQMKIGEEFELPLQVRLLYHDDLKSQVEKHVLEVDPAGPQLSRGGKASFRVMFRDVTMNFDNRAFCLQVTAVARNNRWHILPAVSGPMTVIRHRIRIRSESLPPSIWYKDEGGRDKCIELMIDLVDSDGRRVHGQHVPVKATLLYDDHQTVGKQDILKLSADSRQEIDATGTGLLRVRIEDVSKNHQSKAFVVKVAPDIMQSPLNADISPDLSSNVSVRSKRNRRSRQTGGSRIEDDISSMNLLTQMHPRRPMDYAPTPLPMPPLPPVAFPLPIESGDGDREPLARALQRIGSWAGSVVNGLYQVQWQLLGYERGADGAPDQSRPLFNMCNPNKLITALLASYESEVVEQVGMLAEGLGQTGVTPSASEIRRRPENRRMGEICNLQVGPLCDDVPEEKGGECLEPGKDVQLPTSGQDSVPSSNASEAGAVEASPVVRSFPESPLPSPQHGGEDQGTGKAAGALPAVLDRVEGDSPVLSGVATSDSARSMRPPSWPGMLRGRSVGPGGLLLRDGQEHDYIVSMLPLFRETTYDLLAGMDPAWLGIDPTEPSPNAWVETQVHYIVAREFVSEQYDNLGFPAFDAKHELLGFYKEGRNDQGQTVAFYIPLPPGFTTAERQRASDMLKKDVGTLGSAVAEIANDDLNQLKEKVLTYHWSRVEGQQIQQQTMGVEESRANVSEGGSGLENGEKEDVMYGQTQAQGGEESGEEGQ